MQSTENSYNFFFKKSILPWVICALAAVFYCYVYFLRVSPSVMMDNFLHDFHINATQFGNLSAFFYYAYTPMQFPVGIMIDRWGARAVLTCACLTCVLGLLLFITANSMASAAAGRFLIGFGSAFSYITTLKLASIWLPSNRFAFVAGSTTSLGMCAAMFSENYLGAIVERVGYKSSLYSTLIAGVILTMVIFLIMRNRPESRLAPNGGEAQNLSVKELIISMRSMLANKQMWLIGIIGCLLYLPASVFLDLWGIPFLKGVHYLSTEQASSAISMAFIGWILSAPLIGSLSDHIQKRRLPLVVTSCLAACVICVLFYMPHLSTSALYILLFLLGASCGSHPLCFSLSRENNPNRMAGTSIAVTNFLIMMGGVICQPIGGILLDWHSVHAFKNGIPVYSPSDYTIALSIIPLGLIVGALLTLKLKETHCRIQVSEKNDQVNTSVNFEPNLTEQIT